MSSQKKDSAELAQKLTPLQYRVTQKEGTEPPFQNEYWDNKEPGIYVDVVSGEVLFSSHDKYDSGTGWPSFTRPLEESNIVTRSDRSLLMPRTEVRSKEGDSHLGHRLRRWSGAHGTAVLHELRGASIYSGGSDGAGGLWQVPIALRVQRQVRVSSCEVESGTGVVSSSRSMRWISDAKSSTTES